MVVGAGGPTAWGGGWCEGWGSAGAEEGARMAAATQPPPAETGERWGTTSMGERGGEMEGER